MTTTIHVNNREAPPPTGPRRTDSGGAYLTAPAGGLLSEAPALNRADWIPEGEFEALDELRAEHVRLLDLALEVGREIDATEARFEDEDAAHEQALRAQVTDASVTLPELTPPEERTAAVKPPRDRAAAIHEAREAFAVEAVATIAEQYDEWASELDGRDGEIAARVEEARRALAEAEAAVGSTERLRRWLVRTAGRHARFRDLSARHIAFVDLPVPPIVTPAAPHAPAPAVSPTLPEPEAVSSRPLASAVDRQQQLAERTRRFDEREEQ